MFVVVVVALGGDRSTHLILLVNYTVSNRIPLKLDMTCVQRQNRALQIVTEIPSPKGNGRLVISSFGMRKNDTR